MRSQLLTLFCLVLAPSVSHATAIISAQEMGPDVVLELSGDLDLTGLSFQGTTTIDQGWVTPSIPGVFFAPSAGPVVDMYSYVGTAPAPISASGTTVFSTFAGDGFFVANDSVWVPQGYVSGDPLTAIMTFSGQSFASLGLVEGTYTWVLPADNVTFNVVPEPSAALLLGLGLAGLAARRRH